jgi:hypothetical protein
MEERQMIPYFVHEGEMARQERQCKRLWVLCILLFVSLLATNAGWLWYESQFVDEVVTQDVDTGNGDAIVAGIGDIYGTSETDS